MSENNRSKNSKLISNIKNVPHATYPHAKTNLNGPIIHKQNEV